MAETKYFLGLDYGTESGRVMLVNGDTGEETAWHVVPYPHGVVERQLPDGTPLALDSALQDPEDYLTVLREGIRPVLRSSSVSADRIGGIGVAFTASTVLCSRCDGTPLSSLPAYRSNPHAWVKLWKHHAAQPQAIRINEIASARNEEFLSLYGGGYSSEWFFSKVLETLEATPDVYQAADRFIEACDWIVWRMTGREVRSECAAGYKAMWIRGKGWPSVEFFAALNPQFANVVEEKVRAPVEPLGNAAGGLTDEISHLTGLNAGTPVAVSVVDAHAAVPACAVSEPCSLVMIMGTSLCHMLLASERKRVEGVAGLVENGILPGYWGYEAGQAAVGDIFSWFFRTGISEDLHREASKRNLRPEQLLTERAQQLLPGENSLVALDWWNGSRSILMNPELSGLIVGLTLDTRPEDIYRALVEATAYGTQTIITAFEKQGVEIRELVACGGLAEKSPLVMQIFADVTGRPIRLPRSVQATGLGAAMHAAVASGYHPNFKAAASAMAARQQEGYEPDPTAYAVYRELFAEYCRLHDLFGRGYVDVMHKLRSLKARARPLSTTAHY